MTVSKRRSSRMDRQIRQLGAALLILFTILFIRLNQVQVYQSSELTANPLNARRVIRDFGQPRGDIVTADGVVIATSQEAQNSQFARRRSYPKGSDYAHITGYFSFEYGATGVERSYNDSLSGNTEQQRLESFFDFFGDGEISGDVILNIDSRIQTAAINALGQRNGAVVAIDPKTGAVLAFHSWPTFDPNGLSDVDLNIARRAKLALDDDEQTPLLTRAHRELYPPGSTFKVITAAAALESGRISETDPTFEEVTHYRLPLTNFDLSNYGGRMCGGQLAETMAKSCNAAYAEMAAEYLGPEPIVDMAQRFGFNQSAPFDIGLSADPVFPTDYGKALSQSPKVAEVSIYEASSLLAQAAIGQYDVKATPLSMALVAAGVANDGKIMQPHVVSHVLDAGTKKQVDSVRPKLWLQTTSASTAQRSAALMVEVVENGTATLLRRPGYTIGAKTGTAEVGSETGDSHAWIIAFAGKENEDAQIAVAVLVEAVEGAGQQGGSVVAGPIAASVIDAAIEIDN